MWDRMVTSVCTWLNSVVFSVVDRRKRPRPRPEPEPDPSEDEFSFAVPEMEAEPESKRIKEAGSVQDESEGPEPLFRPLDTTEQTYWKSFLVPLEEDFPPKDETMEQWRARAQYKKLPTCQEMIERHKRLRAEREKPLPVVGLTDEAYQKWKSEKAAKAEAEQAKKREAELARAARLAATEGTPEQEDVTMRQGEDFEMLLEDAREGVEMVQRCLDEEGVSVELDSSPSDALLEEIDPNLLREGEAWELPRVQVTMPFLSQGCVAPPAVLPTAMLTADFPWSADALLQLSRAANQVASVQVDVTGVAAFRPDMITTEDKEQFQNMAVLHSNDITISVDNHDFSTGDIHTLLPGNWLNDVVVNGYMKLLQLRDGELDGGPSCHFSKTFLTTYLFPEYNYAHVKKWTTPRRLKNWGQKKATILECDLIFFPVHLHNTHWSLVVADLPGKTLRYYDSLGQAVTAEDPVAKTLLENIRQYLVDEAADKLKEEWDAEDFSFEIVKEMPQQENLSDCGVFVCRAAKEISGQHPMHFTSEEMQQYRILILKELAAGRLF